MDQVNTLSTISLFVRSITIIEMWKGLVLTLHALLILSPVSAEPVNTVYCTNEQQWIGNDFKAQDCHRAFDLFKKIYMDETSNPLLHHQLIWDREYHNTGIRSIERHAPWRVSYRRSMFLSFNLYSIYACIILLPLVKYEHTK